MANSRLFCLKERTLQELPSFRPFYNVRDRLAVTQDHVTFEQGYERLVIPEPLSHGPRLHAAESKAVRLLAWSGGRPAVPHVKSIRHNSL